MKKIKMTNNKGITLVTLVVTIIVVLILSGITISTMMGENGILTKAAEAKQKTEMAVLEEKIALIMLEWETDKALDSTVTVEDFWERLIDEGIIIDKNDIGEAEISGDNKVYTIDTGDGYVMEMVVSPNGSLAMEDIAKGTDLPLKIKSIDVTEKSTNSISVEVRVRENAGKGDLKLSYYYKTGEGKYEELYGKQDTTDLTATFTGLKKGTTYNIKVVVEKDGQTDELDINVKTEELKEGKVTASLPEWNATTHTASVTLSTTSNYQIQYQKDGTDEEWTTVDEGEKSTTITDLNYGDIINTRLWDGYNGGYEDTVTIEDTKAPTVTATKVTVTTRSIEVTVSSEDSEWGMPAAPTYNYYYKKKADSDYSSSAYKSSTETTCTFDELDQGIEYDIKVTTEDKAGNSGEKELTGIETGTVDAAIKDLAEAPLTASAPTWDTNSHTASITLETSTNYQIQYQIGGIDGDWTTVDEGQNSAVISDLNHNDTVFARLWDGKNAGNEASVKVIDGTAPASATISLGSTSITVGENITATVTHTDNQSGPKATECKWVITTSSSKIGTDANKYTDGTFSSVSQSITYTANIAGTYYLHILTTDIAGNKTETVSLAVTVNTKTITTLTTGKVYYADIDGDNTPDGVIYADLKNGGSGTWGTTDSNTTAYTIPKSVTTAKTYKISQENYSGKFGTGQVLISSGSGNERFYIMALSNIGSTSYTWYKNASGNMSDSSSYTSTAFGQGKTNTTKMITKWKANGYGTGESTDIWSVIQTEVNKGWFVPSKEEWAAFAGELGIDKSNYSSKGLISCWSSSQRNANYAWVTFFDNGFMDIHDVGSISHVRLSTTF